MPAARACCSRAVAPAGNAALRIVTRKLRAVTALGRETVPSAPTVSGPLDPPGQLIRTSVGRRTGWVDGVSRTLVTRSGRGVVHEIHGSGASAGAHRPIQPAPGRPENALDAR